MPDDPAPQVPVYPKAAVCNAQHEADMKIDTSKLLGFRLTQADAYNAAPALSAKVGNKAGTKGGGSGQK